MKKVTIQIVTYNSAADILNCLEAIKLQSYLVSEIIVIDNCSSDNTVKVIKNSQYYKSLQLIENIDNNGFAGGHNQAFTLSESDYVLVLNPDVQLHPDYVYHLVHLLDQHPEIGAVTGKLYRDHEQRMLDSTGLLMKKNRRAFDRGAGEIDRGQYDGDTDIFGVSGAAAMYRRKMVEDIKINGEFFDEVFFAYKEDVDVAWRARLFGWESSFVPEAIAYHKRGWQGGKKRSQVSLKIRKHSYINRYYTILKNDSFSYLILHLPVVLFYEVLSFGYALLKEKEILTAWVDFKANYEGMLIKRKSVKSRQKVLESKVYSYFKGIW